MLRDAGCSTMAWAGAVYFIPKRRPDSATLTGVPLAEEDNRPFYRLPDWQALKNVAILKVGQWGLSQQRRIIMCRASLDFSCRLVAIAYGFSVQGGGLFDSPLLLLVVRICYIQVLS